MSSRAGLGAFPQNRRIRRSNECYQHPVQQRPNRQAARELGMIVTMRNTDRGMRTAVRGGIRLEAEAKGAGSSKAHTARYGQSSTTAHVKVHAGEAVLKALRVVAAGQARAAIAFPVTLRHRAEVTAVQPALASLGITVFWVADDATVTEDGPGSSKPHT
jgi:hypothetical protein